jgi:two-component system OmpR family response regulator
MEILLLEPNWHLARALHRGLLEEGVMVTLASVLPQAQQLLNSFDYDLILLDLPPQSEITVLQQLRRNRIFTPVLLITIPDNGWDKFDDFDLGPFAFLTKPFSFEKLLTEVWRLGTAGWSPRTGRVLSCTGV